MAKQHIIPAFYLKRFTVEGKRRSTFYTYKHSNRRGQDDKYCIQKTTPHNSGYINTRKEPALYSEEADAKHQINENYLSKAIDDLIIKLNNVHIPAPALWVENILPDFEREIICVFVSQMLFRSKFSISKMKEEVIKMGFFDFSIIQKALFSLGICNSKNELPQNIMTSGEKYVELLKNNYQIIIEKSEKPNYFITSSEPVVLVNEIRDIKQNNVLYNNFCVSLTMHYCLLLRVRKTGEEKDMIMRGDKKAVNVVNALYLTNRDALDYLFSPHKEIFLSLNK